MKKTALTICALMLVSLAANAWGGLGHRTIVEIAKRHLTDRAKQNIAAIMPYDMTKDAVWMDAHRNDKGIEYTTAFHVFNVNPVTFKYDPTIRFSKGDCMRAVLMADYVLSNQEEMNDSTLLMNLRMLIHFVGDMHCPSHTYLWNPGGQKWPVMLNGKKYPTFHSIYDKMPEFLFPDTTPAQLAEILDTASKREIRKITKGSIISWGEQAAKINSAIYEINPPEQGIKDKNAVVELDPDTVEKSREIAVTELRNAGYRLAYLLNQYFDK